MAAGTSSVNIFPALRLPQFCNYSFCVNYMLVGINKMYTEVCRRLMIIIQILLF